MTRQPDSLDKLLVLATANGYKGEQHGEKDEESSLYDYVEKSVYGQDCALRRYVM